MITRKVLIPLLPLCFRLAGCAATQPRIISPSQPPSVSIAASVPAIPKPPFSAYQSTIYSDLGFAFAPIIADHPSVIAVGEIHKRTHSTLVSTLSQFAEQALPELARNGYRDIVTEFFPKSRAAQDQLADYLQTGRLGTQLSSWIELHEDYCGIMKLLDTARKLQTDPDTRVTLYGSNLADRAEFWAVTQERRAEIVNEQTQSLIIDLVQNGRKVISYTGLQHNNIVPQINEENRSFGPNLTRLLGPGRYREVDIMLGDLLTNVSDYYLQLTGARGLVPAVGVNNLTFAGRNVLILPYSTPAPVPLDPNSVPVCR